MKLITLHVGLPKTATTSLQTFLQTHQDDLARQSYAYPAADLKIAGPKQQFILREILTGRFDQLTDVLKTTEQPRIILSTEALTNHLYDFSAENLALFRKVLSSHDVQGFIVLREPRRWAKSYYKQSLINGKVRIVDFYATSSTFDEFLMHPRIKRLTNRDQLQNDIRTAYGLETLKVADFDKDWFKTFCKALELKFDDSIKPDRIHESPPDWTMEILRQINGYDLPEENRTNWKYALQEFARTNHVDLQKIETLQGENIKVSGDILRDLRPSDNEDFPVTAVQIEEFSAFLFSNNRVD